MTWIRRIIGLVLAVLVVLLVSPGQAAGGEPYTIWATYTLNGVTQETLIWGKDIGWNQRETHFDQGTAPSIKIGVSGGSEDWYYTLENDNGYRGTWSGPSPTHTFYPYPPEGDYRAFVDGVWAGGMGEEFTLAECKSPDAPTLVSPADEATSSDFTPTFIWDEVSAATEYELQVCYSAACDASYYSAYVYETSVTPSSDFEEYPFYWRVRARNRADGCDQYGGWSGTRVLFITSLSPPSLLSPSNDTLVLDSTPTLEWENQPEAIEYLVQVDNDEDFSSPEVDTFASQSSYHISSPLSEGQYSWRVKVGDFISSPATGWSEVWGFTLDPNSPPDFPSNPTPADGTTNVRVDTTLSWSSSDPDDDPLEHTVYLEEHFVPGVAVCENITATSCDPGALLHNSTYYWMVYVTDGYTYHLSDIWEFTTGEEPNSPPPYPSFWWPWYKTKGISVETSQFEWTIGDDPEGDPVTYDVYFGLDPDHLSLVCDDVSSKYCSMPELDYATKYHWQLVAQDSLGATTTVLISPFTTEDYPHKAYLPAIIK